MKVHIHLEKLEIYSLPCNKSSYFLDSLILIFLCILSALKGHPCIQSNLSTYSLQCYIRLKQRFILIFPCQILIFLNITTESQKIFTFEGQHQNNHKLRQELLVLMIRHATTGPAGRRLLLRFSLIPRHRAASVAPNDYNMTNATQGNSHNARNSHNKQLKMQDP